MYYIIDFSTLITEVYKYPSIIALTATFSINDIITSLMTVSGVEELLELKYEVDEDTTAQLYHDTEMIQDLVSLYLYRNYGTYGLSMQILEWVDERSMLVYL